MASRDFWRVHVGVGQNLEPAKFSKLSRFFGALLRIFWTARRAPFPSWNHAAKEGENFYYTYHDWNLAELELHQSHQVWGRHWSGFLKGAWWRNRPADTLEIGGSDADLLGFFKLQFLLERYCKIPPFLMVESLCLPVQFTIFTILDGLISYFIDFHCPSSTTMNFFTDIPPFFQVFPGQISIVHHFSTVSTGPRHVALLLAEPRLHTGHGAAGRCSVDGWCERHLGGGVFPMDPRGKNKGFN